MSIYNKSIYLWLKNHKLTLRAWRREGFPLERSCRDMTGEMGGKAGNQYGTGRYNYS